ncbi:MAG: ABC transporter substrate-binding protein [Ilumatobacter sp.]|nr:ABC transporter substrate-binding protein [Ilumatobacter sp.]
MQRTTLAGVIAGFALVLGACGDDANDAGASDVAVPAVAEAADPAEPTDEMTDPTDMNESAVTTIAPASTEEPTTTEAPPATTEAPSTTDPAADPDFPQAIISLSPTATEMLYAIGAEPQVLAVDDLSNHPPEAADEMQGLSAFEPNVEAIAGLDPDLVITDGTNPDFLAQLDTLGIPHWEGPAATSFEDVYEQIEQLGAATGNDESAAALVAEMRQEVDEILASIPALDEPLTYYHELDPTYYSVTSDTFIGAVYEVVGLVNIADAVGDGTSYPQLSAEFILDQNPDLIFLACTKYCGETAESVAGRDGWSSLDAVQNGHVIEMDDDIASRWGPRIVEYLGDVGEAVIDVTSAAADG